MNLINRDRALNICQNFLGKRILVVGDLMLDHWVWGKVSRISPEAPVPVVDVQHYSYTPGGAANVVTNLKTLGAEVDLLGVVGADDPGRRLRALLRRQNIGVGGVFVNGDFPTSMKSRIIAGSQQVVRADLEMRTAVKSEVWEQMLKWLRENHSQYAAVVISDYDNGLLWENHIQEMLKIIGTTPVIGGPKPANIDRFRGTCMVTLNAGEAKQASGSDTATLSGLENAGKILLERLQIRHVVITLGERGMALFTKGAEMVKVPALASQVYDVSGAGDTVLSVMSLCLACHIDPCEAICLASHAAAVVVRKVGTATISVEEILEALDHKDRQSAVQPERKIFSRSDATARLARLRALPSPPVIVFTNGCFDILHVGHLRTLLTAKREGDLLIVGVNSDASVKRLKGEERPINSERERAEMLAGLECVDMVIIFEEDTPMALLEELRPDVHVKGGDYSEADLPEAALVKSFGGKIVLTRLIPGRSTTNIILKSQSEKLLNPNQQQ